jgi:hypothetical protein
MGLGVLEMSGPRGRQRRENSARVYRKQRREAVDILRRFVKGEIEEEPLLGFLHSLDLRSIPHLFETLELGNEEIRGIGFREDDLARPLGEFLAGSIALDALRRRIRRISQIFAAAENQATIACRADLSDALNLLALLLDGAAPIEGSRLLGHLGDVRAALDGGRPVPFRAVVSKILREMGTFHFTTLSLLEFSLSWDGGKLPWTDLGLLYGPPTNDPRGDDVPEANLLPIWFIPISVTTRRFYQDGLPDCLGGEEREDCPWMRPESCRVAGLRDRIPPSPLARFRPSYYIDPHGFAEIILDVDEVTQEGLRFAIQLFALENGARAATLEGEEVPLIGLPAGGRV